MGHGDQPSNTAQAAPEPLFNEQLLQDMANEEKPERFKSLAKARGYRARIQARLDRLNDTGPSLSSVASEGQYHALICSTKPRPYPETRPTYE